MITKKIENKILFILSDTSELKLENAHAFFEECLKCIQNNTEYQTVCIDMINVCYIESSGISALVNLKKKVIAMDKNFDLINCRESVLKLFEILDIKDYLTGETNDY